MWTDLPYFFQVFYQINPVQTEKLYGKAMELAGLTGKERVIDAYCGIGTIGMVAAKSAKEVIGVETESGCRCEMPSKMQNVTR